MKDIVVTNSIVLSWEQHCLYDVWSILPWVTELITKAVFFEFHKLGPLFFPIFYSSQIIKYVEVLKKARFLNTEAIFFLTSHFCKIENKK